MFENWQGLRPQVVPLAGSVFNVFPQAPGLGQQHAADSYTSYVAQAKAATAKYDDLLVRIANIGDEAARNELLVWISRSDVPGTPAERRRTVAEDLSYAESGLVAPYMAIKRIGDLEEMNKTLEAKVKIDEQAFASIQDPNHPGQVKIGGVFTPTGIVLGVVSVLGLLVVPLMLRDR